MDRGKLTRRKAALRGKVAPVEKPLKIRILEYHQKRRTS